MYSAQVKDGNRHHENLSEHLKAGDDYQDILEVSTERTQASSVTA